MPTFDITTIGSALKDITFYSDQGKIFATPNNLTAQRMLAFEYGAKITPTEVHLNFGGGAANTAVSLSRLGLKTSIIARLGKDEVGKEILGKFKKEKINTSFIQFDDKNPSGFSFILAIDKKEKEHIAFTCRGASDHFNFKPPARLKSKWFYITSLCGKNWSKNLRAIFAFAKSKNIKISWNPGSLQLQAGKRLLINFLKQTNILILNKDEAIELVLSGIKLGRKNPNHLNRPLYLLNILHEWGPKIVVITDGKKGAWAYNGATIYRQQIIRAKVLDTTGVGDSFGSAFLAGMIINKNDIQKALKWGMINSASVVTKIGAQNGLLDRQELEKKIK